MRTTTSRAVRIGSLTALLGVASLTAQQTGPVQVTYQDLLNGLKDPARWLTYSGDYNGQRHSPLTQITPQNVSRMTPQWSFQTGLAAVSVPAPGKGLDQTPQILDGNLKNETSPIVIDGVMYVTGVNNYAWALDARTGRQIWRYRRELPTRLTACCGPVNRGFGVLGDRLFMVTLDAHLLALDIKTGSVVWDAVIEDYSKGYAATLAPLVVKDKVIVGVAGGDRGISGFIDAYDAESGKRAWRFKTVPEKGEPGSETWPDNDSIEHGGGAVWVTGSYDPQQNLVFFGTGNPAPDFFGDDRVGDNLYTNSLVALDADNGKLRWYYQFTPHDTHDWDSTHVPVLADLTIAGQPRKVVMVANRNGLFYTLDRTTGKVIVAKPYTATGWAREVDANGRPVILNETGTEHCLPETRGGTNFQPPSFDPVRKLFFVSANESCAILLPFRIEFKGGGENYGGGAFKNVGPADSFYSALRAIDPTTGELRWEFRYPTPAPTSVTSAWAGVLSTASGLVFTGDNETNFLALDTKTGKALWHYQIGGKVHGAGAVTYMLDGRQWIVIPSGVMLTAFALPPEVINIKSTSQQ